jgi:alpha-beta hydrolase superfamily lysophospholipase
LSPSLLPFERSFREWIDRNGLGWERVEFPVGSTAENTTGYRLLPAGRPRHRVITLHGAGNDALFAWIGLFKRLLLSGTEVFTFDLPGHGRFNRTRFSGADSVEAVQAALRHCTGGRQTLPVHAIGVSLGGAVLLNALPHLTASLASAALIVTPLRIVLSPGTMAREVGPATLRVLWREREHYGFTGLIPSFGPFKRDVYPLRLAESPPSGPFGYVEALNQELDSLDLHDAARQVKLPVLLIYGERDRIVPLEQGERLAALLPHAELLRVAGGTHLSTPLDPSTTERLLRWMEEHS